ncbi:hypothetical protein MKW98_003781, partial [Papaver atlanticum]
TDTHKFESHYTDNLVGSEEAYFERLPINFVDTFSCPVILFQGLGDKGALAQRRSSFKGNSHFPLAAEVAKKAGASPARNIRPFNRTRQGNRNKQR